MSYDHGIHVTVAPRISRRSLLGSAIALATFATVAPTFAQTATPANQAEGDADALEVLRAAGTNVLDLETFTFSIVTIAGSSTIFPGVELVSVEGAVRRPIDLSATLVVKVLMQNMEISAVVLDGDVYVQDPLGGGAWQNMGSAPQIATMINPDWILLAAINQIQDARITSDRGDSTLIEGHINLLEQIGTSESAELEQLQSFLATGPVDVAFWINSDNYITRAELYGPIFASESADVERRIELNDFNEQVDIEVPDIATPQV
jgi:hypothetical protein